MSSAAPIGVFDSGLGGLSVTRQIRQDMPNERILYFGDSAHAPYGLRPPEQIRDFCFAICDRFLEQGVKAIVVACNTATAAAVNDMRARYSIPIIGMEPALKVACDRGNGVRQHIVVAATPLTLKEHKFAVLMDRFDTQHDIRKQPCPDLVSIVESGKLNDQELVMRTLHGYFDQYDQKQTDSVVLGCTHFVFYRDYFHRLFPQSAILDGNEGTVRHLSVVLESLGELAPEDQQGCVTVTNSDPSERIASLSQDLLGAFA